MVPELPGSSFPALSRSEDFREPPRGCLRLVDAQCEGLRYAVLILMFGELARERMPPERDRAFVAGDMVQFPAARVPGQQVAGRGGGDAGPAVFRHDQELGHRMRRALAHQRHSGDAGADEDQVRATAWLGPIEIKVGVPESAVAIEVSAVEAGESPGRRGQQF